MRTKRLLLAVALAPLLAAVAPLEAIATPISGKIFFTGSGVLKLGLADSTPLLADGIDFAATVAIDEAISTGDYAGLLPATTAVFTDLMGGSAIGLPGTVGAFAVSPFWTFIDGGTGLTYTFSLTSITLHTASSAARVLEGAGVATITGKDPTPGFWTLSTSGTEAALTFSSFASVPDGGTTVAMLGLALVGLGVIRRRLTQ